MPIIKPGSTGNLGAVCADDLRTEEPACFLIFPKQPVIRLRAIAGCVNIRDAGLHSSVYTNCPFDAGLNAGGSGQTGLRPAADRHQYHVCGNDVGCG
jgi:hypothetical protein